MILTISGAACTGKTTLLNKIKEITHPYNVMFYGEFIRDIFSQDYYQDKYEDYASLLRGDPMDIMKIHKDTAQLFVKVLWESYLCNKERAIVFDRSPIDISIYLYMNLAEYLAYPDIFQGYREACKVISKCTYNFMRLSPTLLYTRPFMKEVEQDGFRPLSLIDRRELELSLFDKEFLSNSNVIVLPSSLDDRVEKIKSLLGEKYLK